MIRLVGAGEAESRSLGEAGEHETGETAEARRTVGPVIVTDAELAVLEAAHRRLLAEELPPQSGPEHEAGPQAGDRAAGEDGASRRVRRDVEARAAEREARRSLVARGILDAGGELQEDGDLRLLVTTLLDVRAASPRVLLVERVVAGPGPDGGADRHARRGCRLVYLVASGACVEDVLPDGSHHLYLELDLDEVALRVTEVAVPEDAAAAVGPRRAVDPARPDELVRALGSPTALVELSVLESPAAVPPALADGHASPAHHLVAMGPSGCWLTDVDPSRPLPESLVFRPVGRGWVAGWVRSQLDAAARTG